MIAGKVDSKYDNPWFVDSIDYEYLKNVTDNDRVKVTKYDGDISTAPEARNIAVAIKHNSIAAASGNISLALANGNRSAAVVTSRYSYASAESPNSIAIAIGWGCLAKGVKGSYLLLSNIVEDDNIEDEESEMKPQLFYVDGENIKENTWYYLFNGELKEQTSMDGDAETTFYLRLQKAVHDYRVKRGNLPPYDKK